MLFCQVKSPTPGLIFYFILVSNKNAYFQGLGKGNVFSRNNVSNQVKRYLKYYEIARQRVLDCS